MTDRPPLRSYRPGPWFALLGAHGVWTERTSGTDSRDGRESRAVLTYASTRPQVERAAAALSAATGCTARLFRALEPLA